MCIILSIIVTCFKKLNYYTLFRYFPGVNPDGYSHPLCYFQEVMVYKAYSPCTLQGQEYTIATCPQQDSKANYFYIFRAGQGLL